MNKGKNHTIIEDKGEKNHKGEDKRKPFFWRGELLAPINI